MWLEHLVLTGHPLKVPACLPSHCHCCQNRSAPDGVLEYAKVRPILLGITGWLSYWVILAERGRTMNHGRGTRDEE